MAKGGYPCGVAPGGAGPIDVEALAGSTFTARAAGHRRIPNWPGDIWSRKVERVTIEGRGYGVRAVAELQAGELIAASRALAVTYDDEVPGGIMSKQQKKMMCQAALSKQLCLQLATCWKRGPAPLAAKYVRRLFSMYDGTEAGYGIELAGSKGDKRRRLGLAADGRANLPEDLVQKMQSSDVTSVLTIDPQRVLGMVQMNGDQACCLVVRPGKTNGKEAAMDSIEGSSLFAEAGWLNHSFDGNVVATPVCDVLLLRASRSIRAGEELTRAYMPWRWNQDRLQEDLKVYGIDLCQCIKDSIRILPAAVLQHKRWQMFCKLMARVQEELAKDKPDLQMCEKVLSSTSPETQEMLSASPYVDIRMRLMLVDVRTRQGNLESALDEASEMCERMRRCRPPANDLSEYCIVLLYLCAIMRKKGKVGKLAAAEVQSRQGKLLAMVREFAAVSLAPGERVLFQWACGQFGDSGLVKIITQLLSENDQSEAAAQSKIEQPVSPVEQLPSGTCKVERPPSIREQPTSEACDGRLQPGIEEKIQPEKCNADRPPDMDPTTELDSMD